MSAGAFTNPLVVAATCYAGAEPVPYIKAAAKAGFDGIGIRLYRSIGATYPYVPVVGNAPLIREVKAALADTGLDFLDIFSFFLRPATDVSDFRPAMELGAELGAKYALVLADDPDWQRLVDNMSKVCESTQDLGLVMGIEAPQPRLAMPSVQSAIDLAEATGASNVCVVLDPAQYARLGCDPEDLRTVDPKWFPYSQLTDGVMERDGIVSPGSGITPIKEILAALPSGIPLSVEYPLPADSSYGLDEWMDVVYKETRACLDG